MAHKCCQLLEVSKHKAHTRNHGDALREKQNARRETGTKTRNIDWFTKIHSGTIHDKRYDNERNQERASDCFHDLRDWCRSFCCCCHLLRVVASLVRGRRKSLHAFTPVTTPWHTHVLILFAFACDSENCGISISSFSYSSIHSYYLFAFRAIFPRVTTEERQRSDIFPLPFPLPGCRCIPRCSGRRINTNAHLNSIYGLAQAGCTVKRRAFVHFLVILVAVL